MGKVLISEQHLADIASAIRQKNGESTPYKPREMAAAVSNLCSEAKVLQSLSVTQNGLYTPATGVDGFSSVAVNVSGGGTGIILDPNGLPMTYYTTFSESSTAITKQANSISFEWQGGSSIGACCYLDAILLPTIQKIKYHIELGSSFYDIKTISRQPFVGVKKVRYSGGWFGATDSNWLRINRYNQPNYSGDAELNLSDLTDVCYLYLGAPGGCAVFSNFQFLYE